MTRQDTQLQLLAEKAQDLVLREVQGLRPDQNPFLVYVGGLDKGSRQTMHSTGKLVASTITSGAIEDPTLFPWHALNYGVVRRLRAVLRDQGLAAKTINKALSLTRSAVREAWLLNLTTHEEYQRIVQVKNIEESRLPAGRYVERAEIGALLDHCANVKKNGILGLRDGALLAILVGAGLREFEAVALLRDDYAEGRGELHIRQGKRRKERIAFLDPDFDDPIKHFLEVSNPMSQDPIVCRVSPAGTIVRPLKPITIQAVDAALNKRARAVGVKKFTPHDLRRTFISNQLDKGVDVLRLARAVGHANPKTTMLYDRRNKESDRRAIRGDVDDPEYDDDDDDDDEDTDE